MKIRGAKFKLGAAHISGETEDGSCGGGGPVDRSLEVEFNVGESDLPMDPKQEMKESMQQKSRSVLDFFNFLNFNLF